MMARVLPYPILSVFLLGMWLLLNQSLSPGHIVLGSIIGIAGGMATASLQIPGGSLRRPFVLVRLAFVVLADIIRSNIAVSLIIVNPRRRANSGFVTMQLDLRSDYGLAILACIITSTPGTVWVNFDNAKGKLLIHVLDLIDQDTWIDIIKTRYERPLMEVFE
jgi:multicomponent K+:H+ antiporter subunit E